MPDDLTIRPRRNRRFEGLRALVRETHLTVDDLVMPLFVIEGRVRREEVASMPGIYRMSDDLIVEECTELLTLGVRAVALFPCLEEGLKNKTASEALNPDGLYLRTVRALKEALPELIVITDVAMDPYSSDGHDGVVTDDGRIDNDKTLPVLAAMAVAQARAGADIVAPSDMMDGRVGVLREALDNSGHTDIGILSYAVKYASSYYGPFREALDSAPKNGDKKTYQMDPANAREALVEVSLDLEEGADIVMIKPGLPYLDIVSRVRDHVAAPVSVYNVSGEYAMLRAAAANGWLDYRPAVMETLTSIKRAGADLIFSYHAKEAARWLRED